MTCQEAIHSIDGACPNAIPQAQKLCWLAQLEGLIQGNILRPGEPVPEQAAQPETALTAPAPWDAIYLHWLEMQIHYAHGDISRYNQANAIFRTLWGGYRDHYHRTHLPAKRNIRYR